MLKCFFLTCLVCVLTMGSAHTVCAETHPEVLEAYQAYQIAVKQDDYTEALKQAKTAWKRAEKRMGHDATTGALALNYANLMDMITSPGRYKEALRVFDRAIELAVFDENPESVSWERQIARLDAILGASRGRVRDQARDDADASIRDMIDATQDIPSPRREERLGQLLYKQSGLLHVQGKNQKAIEAAMRAREYYSVSSGADAQKGYYDAHFREAELHFIEGQWIDAALSYQAIIRHRSGEKERSDLLEQSVRRWLHSQIKLQEAGDLQIAHARGVFEALPATLDFEFPVPLMRTHPIMPARSVRSGRAFMIFDLTKQGTPTRIRVAASTDSIFHEAARKTIETWQYSTARIDEDETSRRNIPVKFSFILRDGANRLISEETLQQHLDAGGGVDWDSVEDVIISSGSRIRRRR